MIPDMSGTFSPGQAAEQSGFSIDTLRYYERIGLLDDIDRSSTGHRRFDDDDLEWLAVLRCLRDTGMPIAQMRRYADLARHGDGTMAERLHLLTEHAVQVEAHITLLQDQQKHLREKIDWYRSQLPAAAPASRAGDQEVDSAEEIAARLAGAAEPRP